MADLTQAEVLAMASLAGIPLIPEDLEEVTVRFNALIEALTVLDQLPLDGVTPLPALPHPNALPPARRVRP